MFGKPAGFSLGQGMAWRSLRDPRIQSHCLLEPGRRIRLFLGQCRATQILDELDVGIHAGQQQEEGHAQRPDDLEQVKLLRVMREYRQERIGG